jgi:glutamate racemase
MGNLPVTKFSPIGFFDSGLGGLCIRDAVKELCPSEKTVYIADSVNCPYGKKSIESIREFSRSHTRKLLDTYKCKMIVIACNTATAAAINVLRDEHPDIPFIGLEPAIKPAAISSKTGKIGVLATAGTFGGAHYLGTKARYAQNVEVISAQADEFVELVERGEISGAHAEEVVKSVISPLLEKGCDRIVLGCTHFPHLKHLISSAAGEGVEIIDSTTAVAKHVREILLEKDIFNPSLETASEHIFIRY